MRQDMPDKDITLGEVYRAVLSLKEEFAQTRTEIHEGYQRLRDECAQNTLANKGNEVRLGMIEERNKELSAALLKLKSDIDRTPKGDPMARIGAALATVLTALGAAIMWWLQNAGGK